ncbi:hypothetical protein MLB1_05840 [Mycobacteroides sp. LB1]|nr:hypothetical protein [Mycobacteroides sp. LB1]
MLLMLIVAFPFAIIAGQLNLDPCRWWAVYSIAAAVATLAGLTTLAMRVVGRPGLAVSYPWAIYWAAFALLTATQSFLYAEFRHHCPVFGPLIPVDMFLEWLIAPTVLVNVFRHMRARSRIEREV